MAAEFQPQQAILLLGGAFNPIHIGHIQSLVAIKQYMETKQNYKIISAFCVISTDRYVYGKYKKFNSKAMPFIHRQQMVNLATSKYPWIFPSEFECASAPMYGELIVHEKEYKKYFNKKNRNNINKKQLKNIKRINCMGADKLVDTEGIGIWIFVANLQSSNTMNVAIGRAGYMDKVQKVYDEDLKNGKVDINKFMLININVQSISSTQIRIPLIQLYEKMLSEGDNEADNGSDELKGNEEESKSDANNKTVEQLQIMFKKATENSLAPHVIEYLLNNIKDIWITEDYFEKKKQMLKKNKKDNKSWFSGIKWKKTSK